jgi:23S rRNA U2552 (ribose-2'-O)-methylase RlmE/FtsJ
MEAIVNKLPKQKNNIFDFKNDAVLSSTITYPKLKYGFNYSIYATKDKMEITKNKEKFHYVVNPHEHIIDKYNNSLMLYTPKYFKTKMRILSRAFYKLWEMIFMFDLINIKSKKITTVHLAEGPGSFIQSTMLYREKFGLYHKDDKHYGITLKCDKRDVPDMKAYGKKISIHDCKKDDGDLTNLETINNFTKSVKGSVDLVTADGGFVWKNENYQEQEMYILLLGEILTGLKLQGTNFVIKFFESYTDITIKYMAILQHFYEDVYICKPLMSRSCNSEKYIVCLGYKKPKNYEQKIKQLEELLTKINNKNYVHDIFTDYNLSDELLNVVIKINLSITNNQMVLINKMVEYINSNNYFGDVYHNYRDIQIEKTKEWINSFYPKDKKEYEKQLKTLVKL